MASYLRALNLTNGVEEVVKQIEVDAFGTISGINTLNLTGGTNSIDLGETGAEGTLYIYNNNNEYIDIQYSNNSTEDLQLRIKNTKATLDAGDILVFDDSDSTFKVDNISNYAGSGTGNYHVLKVEFEGGNEFETITELPVGSQLQQITIVKPTGLTTGTLPLTFLIDGSTPVYLATQGVEIDNTTDTNGTSWAIETPLILASGENGVFKSTFLGSGTGSGYAYLYYWTPLP